MCKIIVGDGIPAVGQCRNKVRSVVPLVSPTVLPRVNAHSWTRWEMAYRILHDIVRYIYILLPSTYWVTLPRHPSHETKYQIGMALSIFICILCLCLRAQFCYSSYTVPRDQFS